VVEVVEFEALKPVSDLQIPNLESPIAARVSRNPERQSCREIFCECLVTTLKPVFLGTAVERSPRRLLNALRKRLRRQIICASGDPLYIVFGAVTDAQQRPGFPADPPLSSLHFGSCCVRGADNPTTIAPTA
jgi:hypothetical protein